MTTASPIPRPQGFTIVEMVVVIGIIMLLVGISGGAVRSATLEARAQRCASNLRQIAMATESYRTQSRGALPAAVLYRIKDSELVTEAWDFTQTQSGEVETGPLWTFTDGTPEVHQCPDHVGDSTFGADPFTGYNYNTSYLGAEGRYPYMDGQGTLVQGWANARRGLPPGAQRRPDRCALYGDAGWRNGANKFMRAPSNTVESDLGMVYAGGQSFRHAGGCCNVVHLDGHCERYTMPCAGADAPEDLLRDIMDFPRNGFLSEDDSRYDPR